MKLINAKVVDSIKDLLSKFKNKGIYPQFGFDTPDKEDSADIIVTKSTKLLASINEGVNDKFILSQMSRSLDI